MKEMTVLAGALHAAIPGFAATPAQPPSGADSVDWLAETLGDDFCAYVEWKEFDGWGLEAVSKLAPISRASITLSLDSLYDKDGIPMVNDPSDIFGFAAGGDFFLPTLNDQLGGAGLRLLEICRVKWGRMRGGENPVLVCVSTDETALKALNRALRRLGLALA